MVQLGGSDQWGNIVTGTELIRRKGGGQAFAVTTPLLKKLMEVSLAKQKRQCLVRQDQNFNSNFISFG